jgi:hypothetical protein
MISRLLPALLFVAACGGSPPTKVSTTPIDPPTAASACPMDLPGTSVTVEEMATGGALVFVTTGDLVALRQHIGSWAEKHNAHHGAMGPLPTGDEQPAGGHDHHAHHGGGGGGDGHAGHGGGGGGEWQTMIGVHSRATSAEIDGGVRLELITFPDQIGALRDELRGHVAHLSSTGCAMGH